MMFSFLTKRPTVEETSFAKFIRTASSGEKKRVYTEVMKKATDRQAKVVEQASAKRKDYGFTKDVCL